MRVGVDLDGVGYSFDASFREHMVQNYGWRHDECPEPKTWGWWTEWGIPEDKWLELFREGVEAGIIFTWGEPLPGYVGALTALRLAGHTVHIATHRNISPRAQTATIEWLAKHGVPYDSLTFTRDKTTVNVDVFIDDSAEHYIALEAVGTPCVLFDQPWNRQLEHARRCFDLKNFPALASDLVKRNRS